MGASKRYFITTRELEEQEWFNWYQQSKEYVENWKAEPNDKELFKDDEVYSQILNKYIKAKKELRDYKFDKRNKQC